MCEHDSYFQNYDSFSMQKMGKNTLNLQKIKIKLLSSRAMRHVFGDIDGIHVIY